jgi:hypothetical protein
MLYIPELNPFLFLSVFTSVFKNEYWRRFPQNDRLLRSARSLFVVVFGAKGFEWPAHESGNHVMATVFIRDGADRIDHLAIEMNHRSHIEPFIEHFSNMQKQKSNRKYCKRFGFG